MLINYQQKIRKLFMETYVLVSWWTFINNSIIVEKILLENEDTIYFR